MKKDSNEGEDKFLHRVIQLKMPVQMQKLKKFYKIYELNGLDSDQLNDYSKSSIPGKLRLPLKNILKQLSESNKPDEIYPSLSELLKSLDLEASQIQSIWQLFKNNQLPKAEIILQDYLQFFKQEEKAEYLLRLREIFQEYSRVNHKKQKNQKADTMSKGEGNIIEESQDDKKPNKKQVSNSYEQKNELNLISSNPVEPDGEKNKFQPQYSADSYIIMKLKEKNLWEFESEHEENNLIKDLKKSPYQYDLLISQALGKAGPYIKFINQLKKDEVFKKLLKESQQYPLHEVYFSLSKLQQVQSLLFNTYIQIDCWEMNNILKVTREVFKKFNSFLIETEKQNIQNILKKNSELIFDILIRKSDLGEKIYEMNILGTEKNHKFYKQISVYDFICLFARITHKQKIPYLGYLLHKNSLPIPLITSISRKGKRQYYEQITLIENVLMDKKMKLICNVGTAQVIRKGKTQLIANAFRLQYKSLSNLYCQFHSGCVSAYSNLSSMIGQVPVILADVHGDIFEAHKNKSVRRILQNSNLIIFHIHEKQSQKAKDLIDSLIGAGRFIILERDHKIFKLDKGNHRIQIPQISFLPDPEKQLIWREFRNQIILQIKNDNKFLHYQNVVSPNRQIILQGQLEDKILAQMQKQHHRGSIWRQCFFNLNQFRSIYKMELKILQLERLIKYDKKDERHIQYIKMRQIYQNKCQNAKIIKLFSLSRFYLQNYADINIRSLNSKISSWKNIFAQALEKQLVDYRAKYEKKQGNLKQLKDKIKEKQLSLQQFDISADTIIQEILIVANSEKNDAKFENCIMHYYEQLYKTMNPINLIDGNTLLFGNTFLKRFFKKVSDQMQKKKAVYVISVIGIQSSAKSTLMNYLFNCRFETSAGRCTKGVYFTICQTEKQILIIVDTEGLMSVCARDRVFDIQIATFTFLISDIVIINNKGEINTPIRQLLGVCTYALKELNYRKAIKLKSKVFFAIRDQFCAGVQKQKSMLSDIINSLKNHSDLANFEDFLDFNSEDIYPLQSAFNKVPTNMDTTIQKPNECFSESILAMRSKILTFLKSKQKDLSSIEKFYQQSQKKWEAIRECGQHIFNFQQILQIRIKKGLKEVQLNLLEEQFSKIGEMISQSVKSIERITKNDQLTILKKNIIYSIERTFIRVRFQIKKIGENTKGAKAEWISDLIQDCKRQFNQKIMMHIEYIDSMYKEKIKKNKAKNFDEKISQIISSILKTDRSLQQIRVDYQKECKKLLQQEQFIFDDTQLVLKALIQEEVTNFTKTSYRNFKSISFAKAQEQKFDVFFANKADIFLKKQQRLQYVEMINKRFDQLKCLLQNINDKFQPINGQHNEQLIQEYGQLISNINQKLKQVILKKSNNYFFASVRLREDNFKFNAFTILCVSLPKLIIKNRINAKQRAIKQKNQLIQNKWKQIEQNNKIKGNSLKVADKIMKQFSSSILTQLFQKSEKELQSSLLILINKFNPVKIIEEAIRLTFRSTSHGKVTWIKCFKVIYDFQRFLQEEILFQQDQYLQLKNKVQAQKQNCMKRITKILDQVKYKMEQVKNLKELGLILNINIKSFEYEQNIKIFDPILTQIKDKFQSNKLDKFIQEIKKNIISKNSIFNNLQSKLNQYVKNKLGPKIIGCQKRCPCCSMKCKLSNNHFSGHECVEGSHLQTCFAGQRTYKTHLRSKGMCFTEDQIKYVTYKSNDEEEGDPTLKYIEQHHSEWLDHFKKGPYQDRINELNCQRIWANIGDVLIETKFKDYKIINSQVKEQYKNNPLKLEDIKDWIKQGQFSQ